jgi:dienelactone hydrolase
MRRVVLCLTALVVLAAGCGSDSADDSAAEPDPTEAATVGPTSTESSQPTTTTSTQPTTTTTTELAPPSLFSEPGPFDVGVITLDLGDRLTEVWYPADPAPGAETEIFNSLDAFPEEFQDFIPPELSPVIETGTYRDADPTAAAPSGGFPLVIYSHGASGYRQVTTAYARHLASWGHVVASTDHVEQSLAAQVTGGTEFVEGQREQDILAAIDKITSDPILGPLTDSEKALITGHSAGAGTAASMASEDIFDGYVSISGWAPDEVAQKPALVVIGELDNTVPAERSIELFEALETDAVLVNIAAGGHNSFTDSCRKIRDGGGLGALTDLIGENRVEQGENGCVEGFLQPEAVQAALNHYTVALLASLFGNPWIGGDPLLSLTEDVTADLAVPDLDAGATGVVVPKLADFGAK